MDGIMKFAHFALYVLAMCDRLRYIVKNIPQGKNMSSHDKFPLMTHICARHTRSPTCGILTNMVEGRADTPGSEELVSKRGFSFIIWNWFGFKKSYVEQQLTTCKVCKQIVPIKDSNTTNLFHHLKHKHKPDYEDSQKMRKDAEAALTSSKASGKEPTTQKLTNAFAHSTPSDHQSKQWKELTEAVAFCLVKDV